MILVCQSVLFLHKQKLKNTNNALCNSCLSENWYETHPMKINIYLFEPLTRIGYLCNDLFSLISKKLRYEKINDCNSCIGEHDAL